MSLLARWELEIITSGRIYCRRQRGVWHYWVEWPTSSGTNMQVFFNKEMALYALRHYPITLEVLREDLHDHASPRWHDAH